MKYHLAVDIGASSGRHILGWMQDGVLQTKEIYRFQNGIVKKNGKRLWDFDNLFAEILNGLRACKAQNMIPTTMGIDTWGVDFVLLDENGKLLGDTVSYRDNRTEHMADMVEQRISEADLYATTGTQKQRFNTIYQLQALQQQTPALLTNAKTMLLVPAYFSYLLTGIAKNEYTEASTTGLVNAKTRSWDLSLIEKLGYPTTLFTPLAMPGETLGALQATIAEAVGFGCTVLAPGSHDTASAVMAVPTDEASYCYISSGTWSLMGTLLPEPIATEQARSFNLTNEGGYAGSIRLLKNIMGTWMIQSVKKELTQPYSFDDLCDLAEEAKDFPSLIDVNDDSFLAPDSMMDAIRSYCATHGQAVPQTVGEIMSTIYRSLALCYADTFAALQSITGTTFDKLYIVGGGSKDWYLNQLTANAIGKPVSAGPGEATAIGNLLAQLLGTGICSTTEEASALVRKSFAVKLFHPTT